VIFIHIPKAAGTSIATAIYGKRIGHFTYHEFRYFIKDDFNKYPIFTVLRNPYERLISAYNFAKQGGTLEGAVTNESLYQTYPFRSFQSFVKEWLSHQDVTSIDLIFRPQTFFLPEIDALQSSGIKMFYINQLNELEHYLTEILKREIKIEKRNVSSAKLISQNLNSIDLETKILIEKIYKSDFDLLKTLQVKNE
jgi:hypothetical protein